MGEKSERELPVPEYLGPFQGSRVPRAPPAIKWHRRGSNRRHTCETRTQTKTKTGQSLRKAKRKAATLGRR